MSENGHQEIATDRNFYRIGEVSRLTDTKPFVLRYWETEFPTLQPVKSPKGHRLYRRKDVDTVLLIKRLLYDEGFTIAGARRHLREVSGSPLNSQFESSEPRRDAASHSDAPAHPSERPANISRRVLLDLRDSLRAFLTLLETE
jgi:DNA-binding transcriptional MerR regulator